MSDWAVGLLTKPIKSYALFNIPIDIGRRYKASYSQGDVIFGPRGNERISECINI